MTNKSQAAFEDVYHRMTGNISDEKAPAGRLWALQFYARCRESLKQELLSEEMVEKVRIAIEAGYVQNRFGATEYAKAALQAVVEGI